MFMIMSEPAGNKLDLLLEDRIYKILAVVTQEFEV